jgi:RNA polymerase-interacting CarD/CdnL/TRCF family regulator
MNFHVGDPVMHWVYGFGHVVGIEERDFADRKNLYYAISTHHLTVWVPADDQLNFRLRSPSTEQEFTELFAILSGAGDELPDDRQVRKLWLVEKLKDGRAKSLCRVLRALASYQNRHSLNDNDHNLMKRSRDALVSEWTHVLSVTAAKAEADLFQLLSTGAAGEPKRK